MKRITVNAGEIVLVTKHGRLLSVLSEGKHWIGFKKKLFRMKTADPFKINDDQLAITKDLLEMGLIKIETIAENEIAVEMKDGVFNSVLLPGKTAYWIDSPCEYIIYKEDKSQLEAGQSIPDFILENRMVKLHLRHFKVDNHQKGLLFIDGKYTKTLEPGQYKYWINHNTVQVQLADMRIRPLDVAGQEILTKDKAGVRITFTSQYKITDVEKASIEVKDYEIQLYKLFQLVLREYLGTLTLDQLLSQKTEIGDFVFAKTKESAKALGVKILNCGIKDVILPGDVKDIMNQVLIAQKKAQANTIMRQEETASTRSLLNTAKLMENNKMLWKLKEMEYVEKIADKVGEITINGGGSVVEQLKKLVVKT